jgi:hypothetical protein
MPTATASSSPSTLSHPTSSRLRPGPIRRDVSTGSSSARLSAVARAVRRAITIRRWYIAADENDQRHRSGGLKPLEGESIIGRRRRRM